MATGVYNRFRAGMIKGDFDLENDDIKVALMDDNHSFSEDDNTWSDVSANEISGTNYDSGGKSLSNKSVTQNDTDNKGEFDADDITWSDATFSAYHAVIYDDTNSNDELIASLDFGSEISVSDGDFTIEWDSEGIIHID